MGVRLAGKLPEVEHNGLQQTVGDLIGEPEERRTAIIVYDVRSVATDVDTGDQTATIRILEVEPVTDDLESKALTLLIGARERRTSRQAGVNVILTVDPDTGEIVEADNGGGE